MSPPAYFTVEEASRMLPLVRRIVADIMRLFAEIHERRERVNQIRRASGGRRNEESVYSEELRQVEQEIEQDAARLDEFLAELTQLGVELKDPVRGLIDFRAKLDGRDIYLCWHAGEEEIGHWHEIDAGFAGRRPLLELSGAGREPGDGVEESG